jgi:O-antigen ligase
MHVGGVRQPPATLSRATVLTVVGLGVLAVGAAMTAVGLQKATALLLGMLFLIPALLNLPVAMALWAPLGFMPALGFIGAAPTAAAVVILLAWLPTLRKREGATRELLRLHAPAIAVGALLLLWLTLSISWAERSDIALSKLWQWWLPGGAFLLAVTTIGTRRHARLFIWLLILGAVLSAVIGYFGESLTSTADSLELAAEDRRRFGSFLTDPNYLAAGFIAVIVLATGLIRPRHPFANATLVAAMALLTVAFSATESRGALVAAGVAAIAALIFYARRRAQVVIFLALFTCIAAVFFSVNPEAWKRVSEFDATGSGRSGLWEVAWRITEDHPVTGVGLENFEEEAPKYTLQPGRLDVVRNIAERPHVAHNVYLQFLAETGVVGLTLFVVFLLTCMRAAWRAGSVFDDKGDAEMAALARACLVALIAFAAASFFISDGNDVRFWMLMALGPIMYGAAVRTPALTDPAGVHRRYRRGRERILRGLPRRAIPAHHSG